MEGAHKVIIIRYDYDRYGYTIVAERDRARQELIEQYGIRFYRCTSAAVEQDLERVLAEIRETAG